MSNKITVFFKTRKKPITIDKKIAAALVRMNRAKYITKPSVTVENRMMTPQNLSNKQNLRSILDAAGIEYDGRMGEKKLKELVDSIGKENQ